jgi:Ca-activated chloride channel family protein
MRKRPLTALTISALILAACTASAPKSVGKPAPENERDTATKPSKILTLKLEDLKAYEIKDTEAGKPVGFTLENGMKAWAVKLQQPMPLATPAISNGRLYVGGGFGSYDFYCLDANTGKTIWRVTTTDDGPTGAVVSGDYVAYNTESCTLEVRLCSNGELAWGRWLGDPLMSQPAISEDRVLMCWPNISGGQQEQAAPDNDGDPVPDNQTMQNSSSPDANKLVHGGVAVNGTGTHALGCFDLKTGSVHWAVAVPGDCISAPVVEGGIVYAATLDGSLTQVDLKTGKVLGQEKQNATSAPWIMMRGNEPEAICAQRDTRTETVDGKETQVHYEGWRSFDREAQTRGDLRQTRKADYLHRENVEKNEYYGANAKAQQDSGVGFASAPEAAQAGTAMQNLGEGSIVGLWAFQGSRPMVHRDRVYNCLGNKVSGGDTGGEKVEWELTYRPDRNERLLSPPAAAGGQLVFAGLDGAVFTLDSATGELKHAVKLNKCFVFQPAVMEGKIYLSTLDGWLITIDTGDKALDGWSMWGGGPAHNGK